MRIRYIFYAVLFPMIATSGQGGDSMQYSSHSFDDSIKTSIQIKSDSIAYSICAQLDSAALHPKLCPVDIDRFPMPIKIFTRWKWFYKDLYGDTVFLIKK
jgi:hypothetical protein